MKTSMNVVQMCVSIQEFIKITYYLSYFYDDITFITILKIRHIFTMLNCIINYTSL